MKLRRQYHFRNSLKGDLLAWDVNKLITKTDELVAVKIKISQIKELEESYWYDLGDAKPTCENIVEHIKLIEKADLSYPIILCKEGKLMDGMHRVCKAKLLGYQEILAFQFKELISPDFINVDPEDLIYD